MKKLLTLLCLSTATAAIGQTTVSDNDLANAYSSRSYSMRVSCHDPSIVIDNIASPSAPTYYIYGSHLGRGKTTQAANYQEWTTFKTGEENTGTDNSLFANVGGGIVNYSNAYSSHAVKTVKNYKGEDVSFGNFDAHGWQFSGNTVRGMQWAPDVIYNKKMKKWCMYMSVNGDNWCSSIVCLTADNIEGPWTYQGPVVFSGFSGQFAHNGFGKADDWKRTDLSIATGETALPARYKVTTNDNWGNYWPNCIDPCVFYDDDNNLWMTYGSWSGGIYILKLNEDNGLRDYQYTFKYEINGNETTPGNYSKDCTCDPYFGKKIAGGYYVSGEASYIEKIGKHYFLFMSYGGLESNGGYQMRIFRSDNPEGPYKDCYGTSALFDKYLLNYGNNANDNRGVLLMGGYQWDTMPVAEIAQGHNSAFIDDKGRAFVVYHTRFNNGTEGHEVRVHQLWLNDEGWIMAAPFEFDGETVTDQDIAAKASIDDSEIEGDYQLLRHRYYQNVAAKEYQTPVNIHLDADGIVSGEVSGKWERTPGTDYIALTIGTTVYRGVLVRQTIDYTDIPALCITALSSSSGVRTTGKSWTYGQELWAVKADARAAIKYTLDKLSIPVNDGATINSNIQLPTAGNLGAIVEWKSSDTNILSHTGRVRNNGKVTLTLTITKDDCVYTREYHITVDKDAEDYVPVFYPESTQKNLTAAWWTNFTTSYFDVEAGKKIRLQFYNYSDMAENWNNWGLVTANAERGATGYKEYFVLRNDNFGWGDNYDASGLTSNYNWDTFKSDMNGSLVDMTVSLTADGAFKMESTITTTSKKVYNYGYTTTIASKPSKIKLFFVNEKSYIDGSTVTGIENAVIGEQPQYRDTDAIYNISGQRVDKSYRGIVIINGKKYIRK